MLWGISETVHARAFKPLPLCSANVGSSAKFCVVVCKSSLLWYLGDPLPKVGSSSKFCVVVCKSSLLWYLGAICQNRLSTKFCVVVCKSSLLWYLGDPLPKVGSSSKFCVVVCKSSLLWYLGGPLAKVGSSGKFCVVVCKSSPLWYWGSLAEEGSSAKFGVAELITYLVNEALAFSKSLC